MAAPSAQKLPAYLYDDQTPSTLGAIIPFAVLSVIAVALRFWARRVQTAGWKLDDWLAATSLVFSLGCFILSCEMIHYGSGQHVAVVPPENFVPYLQSLFAYEFVYATTILTIKLSLLAFYVRVFSTRGFRITVWVVAGIVLAWYIAVIFVSIFSCDPISGFWNKTTTPPPTCISSKHFFVGNAIPNIITDIIILVLPVRMVWTLHMRTAQKVSLSFIFLLGGFVIISSIVRLVEQFKVDDPDFTWAMNGTVIWTSLEVSCGVISASLPTLRPLLQFISPSLLATNYGSSKKTTQPTFGSKQSQFENLSSSEAQKSSSERIISSSLEYEMKDHMGQR